VCNENIASASIGRKFHLDPRDGLSRVETFGAGARAVEDGVTTVHTQRVLKFLLPVSAVCIPRIGDPSVSLHQGGRSKVLVLVPPVRRARGRAASAKNALVHAIEFPTVLLRLNVFALLRRVIVLQIWLNRLVLLVEEREIGNQVFDDVHVRERINLRVIRGPVDSTETRKSVLSINIHGTRSTYTLSARPPEGKCGVNLVFNFD